MSAKPTISMASSTRQLSEVGKRVTPYSFLVFLVFAAVLYGFVLMRINTLTNTQPSEDVVASQVKSAKLPKIDEDIVKQLKSLQDNSVSVQTLFQEARSNPFQ